MWGQIAVLACLATGLLAAPERPDAGVTCPRSQGLFSHPTDCHLFVHCDHDHPYVKECPANLHFNPTLMVCDWPENAGCTGGTPIDPPTPDVDPEPNMECDCECCLEPNSDDCSTYYICKDGKDYKQHCGAGLVFNPNIDNCDLPSNYKCDVPASTPKPATTKAPTTPAPKPSTTTSSTPKPVDFDCPTSNGLFPNPKDCHTFYHCSNGYAYLKDCPANLEFNPVLLVCDWPENAGCNGKSTVSPQPTPSIPTPSDFDCPTSDGLFPNPKDCHTFYHCSNDYAYLKDCPANLEFNPVLLVCDWPENAGCNGKSTVLPQPTPSIPTPSDFDCPTSDGLFPNPKDCHTFYHCSNDYAYLKDCPANLEFNPVLLVCDWPENAGCNGKSTVLPQPTPSIPTPSDFDCPTSNGLFPNPKDCHTFYHCSNDYAYLKDCPANLEFNPVLLVCDWPNSAGCSIKPTTPKPTTPKPTTTKPTTPKATTTKPSTDFDCPTSNGLFPNPKDCHTFYHCSNGYAYLKDCPANLEFNPVLLVCDWPDNAGCNGKSTVLPQPTPSIPTPSDFDCPTSDGLFPNPKDCHTFYHCSNDYAYLKDCPANLEFNPVLLVCDWPENAGCNGKSTVSPQPTPSIPTPSGFDCPTSNGLFPNPKDCHTFYHCSNDYAYLKDCPANLEFNPVLLVCDWPNSAGCSIKPTTPKPTTPKPTTTKPTTPKATTTKPSTDFDCPTSNGLFPNPKDCHTFYHCSNGYAYLKDCPANLEFNPVLLVCDWPNNAGCNGKSTVSPQPTPSIPTPSDFDCPTSDGLFPNPKDCHTFYHCSNDYAYLKDCPTNLEFNPVLLVCDWPNSAGCSIKPTTPKPTTPKFTTPKPTTIKPSPDFNCSSDGLFPNPKDCHTFYHCSNGYAYLKDCPSNLEFNPVLLVCDWPNNAGCSIKPTTSKPTTIKPTTPKPTTTKPTTPKATTTKPSTDFDCPTSNGLFPNPKDCHTFYHCSNGYDYLKDCPANLEFNPVLLVCDWPDSAGCNGKSTVSPVPTSKTTPGPTPEPPIICPNETCSCRLPDPKNCACFYKCDSGAGIHECCSPGLYFNKDTEVCDLPENVDCDPVTTPMPPATTSTTTQKPTIKPEPTTQEPPSPSCTFPCTKSDGFYGNPLNCGTYFDCSAGQATIHYCPSDKHFNTGTNSCDAPESAGCCEL